MRIANIANNANKHRLLCEQFETVSQFTQREAIGTSSALSDAICYNFGQCDIFAA